MKIQLIGIETWNLTVAQSLHKEHGLRKVFQPHLVYLEPIQFLHFAYKTFLSENKFFLTILPYPRVLLFLNHLYKYYISREKWFTNGFDDHIDTIRQIFFPTDFSQDAHLLLTSITSLASGPLVKHQWIQPWITRPTTYFIPFLEILLCSSTQVANSSGEIKEKWITSKSTTVKS